MNLNCLTVLLKPKNLNNSANNTLQSSSLYNQGNDDPDAIITLLMDSYRCFREFCRKERLESSAQRSWKLSCNQRVSVNNKGIQIIRDDSGKIVKTRDAMRRVKEFRYNSSDCSLEVSKYGVWNKLDCGRLTETGTLVWRRNGTEYYEFLDGTALNISFKNSSLIAHNELSGEQVSISKSGMIGHSFKKDAANHFRTLKDCQILTWTETFDKPVLREITIKSGKLSIESISRIERTYNNGRLESEKFLLENNKTSRPIAIRLKSPPGELHLSKVGCLQNRYEDGRLSETLLELQEPVSISKDLEAQHSILQGLKQVRSFQIHDQVCSVVYMDSNGDENLFFPQV